VIYLRCIAYHAGAEDIPVAQGTASFMTGTPLGLHEQA
jgi:hypothetical protein